MKNIFTSFMVTATVMLFSSCLYDKAENAEPVNGCDTTYYTLTIKPIIDNNCAVAGCHVAGGSGTGNFTTYAGIKPYIENNQVPFRINLDPNDPLHMPLGSVMDSLNLVNLNNWIAAGYEGCD